MSRRARAGWGTGPASYAPSTNSALGEPAEVGRTPRLSGAGACATDDSGQLPSRAGHPRSLPCPRGRPATGTAAWAGATETKGVPRHVQIGDQPRLCPLVCPPRAHVAARRVAGAIVAGGNRGSIARDSAAGVSRRPLTVFRGVCARGAVRRASTHMFDVLRSQLPAQMGHNSQQPEPTGASPKTPR